MRCLSLSDFSQQRSGTFIVKTTAGVDYPLRLADISPLPPSGIGARQDPFSLIFQCDLMPPLPQGTHAMTTPEGENLAIFLVPVGLQDRAVLYQAIFN